MLGLRALALAVAKVRKFAVLQDHCNLLHVLFTTAGSTKGIMDQDDRGGLGLWVMIPS